MPSAVFCHGFLTVNGEKMSKRRGTFIQARTYADHLDSEYLRYYFACKLGDGIDDMDLNLDDFVARVNSDLVGKVVNIASRCARLLQGLSEGRLAGRLHDPALYERFASARDVIAGWIETREYGRAMREVMALADLANRYIDEHKPWIAARDPERRAEAHAVCSTGIELFRGPRRVPQAGPARDGGEGGSLPRGPAARVGRSLAASVRGRGAPHQPL